jgi:dTDP-4-dehydrorhamnose reductase
MRILILGGSGMLGHRLWINLRREHEVWVTVRGERNPFPNLPEFPAGFICYHVDGLNLDDVASTLASVQPDLVINCIGLIKQSPRSNDSLAAIQVNAVLPHRVALICRIAGIRMIHFSTDCVFSGRKGNYVEEDLSDAEDLYGRTKFLGEMQYPHTITLRTSIIGQEIKNHLGLIDWFLSQTGTITGYQRAIYTGFTTDELSRIIMDYVIPRPELSGLYHVSSQPISKYDLLMLAKEAYGQDVKIIPDQDYICDRSLNSTRFRQAAGYTPPNWKDMISAMASQASFYDQFRG